MDPTTSLLLQAEHEWKRLLERGSSRFSFMGYDHLDWEASVIRLTTDECVFLLMDFAEQIGIDLDQFGKNLSAEADGSKFTAGVALRTVLEVEGYYIERPGASSYHEVPKGILLGLGAALVGMATAKASALDPSLGGAVGGAGALMINVLSSRFSDSQNKQVDFYGELILRLLDDDSALPKNHLLEYTRFHEVVLDKILVDLLSRGAIGEQSEPEGEIRYFKVIAGSAPGVSDGNGPKSSQHTERADRQARMYLP